MGGDGAPGYVRLESPSATTAALGTVVGLSPTADNIGAIQDAPVVRGGEVVVGKTMPLSATFDHRLLDGVHAANMVGLVKRWFADPFGHFDPIPGPAGGDPSAGDDAAQSLR